MLELDCSSPASALASLSKILDVAPLDLQHACRSIDVQQHLASYGCGDFVHRVVGRRSSNVASYPSAYFHATRVLNPELFRGGLLPLGDVLERVWSDVYEVARRHCSRDEWAAFRGRVETHHPGHFADLYRAKMAHPDQWGPYGFLIREVPLNPARFKYRDYLRRPPEIVEDICVSFQEDTGIDLVAAYVDISTPCLVKFRAASDPDDIVSALLYFCCTVQGLEFTFEVGANNRSSGRRVPGEDIISIEINPEA